MAVGTTFTTKGAEVLVDWIDGTVSAPHTEYIGWGEGTTTPAAGDTALQTPAAMQNDTARRAATRSQNTAVQLKWVHSTSCEAAGTITINEVGLFDAAGSSSPPTGGNLIIHAVHAAAALAQGDKIDYTITLSLS